MIAPRRYLYCGVWLLVMLVASACVAPAASPAASGPSAVDAPTSEEVKLRIVSHAMGTAEIPCAPQRIVTLGQDATDAVLALGITPIGAVDPWGGRWYAYLGDRMANVVSLGSETEPNLETLVSLRPDLILGSRLRHEAVYEQLRQIAPTVFTETIGRTWKENFQRYAQALCREEEGNRLIAAWNERIADFQEKMGERLKTEVSLIRFRADEVRIYTTGFPGSILREAGLSRPESQRVEDWESAPQVLMLNKEQIPLMDGDVIFYMVSDWGDDQGSQIMEEWTGHPLWQTLKAVQNNAVHPVNEEHWNLGGGILAANRMLDDLYSFFLPEEQSFAVRGNDRAFPVVIEHKFGRTEISEPPERVVTLGYSEQDVVLALGVKPVAVREWFGEQPYAVWPWAQAELGDATPTVLNMPFGELNYEAIAALRPDLIIATHSGITADEYTVLAQIAPTLAQSGNFDDFGMPWQEQTRVIGRALGRSAEAEALIADVEAQIAAAANPAFAGKTIAWITPADTPGEFWVTGPNTPPLRFLAALGFAYPAELAKQIGDQWSLRISSERLDLIDTDVLIVRVPSPETFDAIRAIPLFQQLRVVKEGRTIYFVGNDPIYGALSFSTVNSLPYVLEHLTPMLLEAVSKP